MPIKNGWEFLAPASREQRREEATAATEAAIHAWGDEYGVETESFPVRKLAERLFNLEPAYCPYDSGGCHDDECPCSNCETEPEICCADHVDGCQAPAYPCCDNCPNQGD